MHVLQIVSAKESNGVLTHLRLLLPALRAAGHRITVITRQGSPFGAEFAALGLETIESDLHRRPDDELDRFSRLVRQEKVQVIHTHMCRANNFGARLQQRTGVPCVMTAHALQAHPHWRTARLVLAVSEAAAQFHRRWSLVPARRMRTVLNFIDLAALRPEPGMRERLQGEWGVKESELVLGVVGRVSQAKGHDILLEALPRVRAPLRLVVVGDGRPDFVEAAKQKADARVVWLGYRTDVASILSALDGVVLPTRRETISQALLEAMALRLPLVASRVGGIPELIEGGHCGFLVRPGDPGDLAAKLDALAALSPAERAALGASGRRFVEANATVASQVPKIEAALFSVL